MALVPFRERDYLFPNHQKFWDVVHFLGLVRDFGYRDEDELNRSAKNLLVIVIVRYFLKDTIGSPLHDSQLA